MTIESAQDRLDMLEALGEGLIYTANGDTHVSSKSVCVTGIFEKPYVETQNITGYAPVVTVRDSDVDGVVAGAQIRRNVGGTDIDYTVKVVEADGTGITNLILQAQ